MTAFKFKECLSHAIKSKARNVPEPMHLKGKKCDLNYCYEKKILGIWQL